MNENNRAIIFEQYLELIVIEECVKDFRNVFTNKDLAALHGFIKKYINCSISNLRSFANGLKKDIDAVEQTVTSPYSNGFVEGNNHD